MRIAFGAKAHSGWAVLVGLGDGGHGLVVVDRRRIELAEGDHGNQPYHAAQALAPAAALVALWACPPDGRSAR